MNKICTFIKTPKFSEGERCYYPIRGDVYNKGCEHNCLYCYSRALNTRFGQWNQEHVNCMSIEEIRKVFITAFESDKQNNQLKLLRKRFPLRLGGLTDLFQPIERNRQITYELIKLLNMYQYPYLIVTKSALIGEDKYLKILDKELCYVQLTITTLNDNLAQIIEPHASKIIDRVKSLRNLVEIGIYTAARVSPIIPLFEDGYFSQNRTISEKSFDYFSFELINTLCEQKPNTLMIEFLRISPVTRRILVENDMKCIVDLFNHNTVGRDGTLHLSKGEKECYIKQILKLCNEHSIDFTICDDFHFDYFRKYWANKDDCCNGLGKIKGFNKTWK